MLFTSWEIKEYLMIIWFRQAGSFSIYGKILLTMYGILKYRNRWMFRLKMWKLGQLGTLYIQKIVKLWHLIYLYLEVYMLIYYYALINSLMHRRKIRSLQWTALPGFRFRLFEVSLIFVEECSKIFRKK